MELTRFDLDAEKRDKRKVEALERLAAAAERIAAALEGERGQTKTTPAASEEAGEEAPRESFCHVPAPHSDEQRW